MSAFAFGAVGDYFPVEGSFANVLGNAIVGGGMAELQGGKFGHGFAAAGLSAIAKPSINSIADGAVKGRPLRIIAAAIVGGTASAVGGGKFANGAVTAAFSQAFNGEKALAKRKKLEEIRAKIAEIAESYLGDENYGVGGTVGSFGPDSWKCNCFVMNILNEAGAVAPMLPGGKWPYKANYWANPDTDIPGYEIVQNPIPGDVAAFPRKGNSGHVGIYVGGWGRQVIAAGRSDVQYSQSHFLVRMGLGRLLNSPNSGPTVYRRWVGFK